MNMKIKVIFKRDDNKNIKSFNINNIIKLYKMSGI